MNSDELFSGLNRGLLQERGSAFRRNLEKNLSLIKKHGGLADVIPALKERHVIIAGAGPSLDRSAVPMLGAAGDDSFVIIASDMAVRPLYERGIVPQFVITCETTPVPFFSGIDTSAMHLLAFSCSSHATVRSWRGPLSFYNWMLKGEFYDSLWERAGTDLGFVATGSIVTTQAVAIAMGCGVLSLMLAGNDLGFYDRFYASGTVGSDRLCATTGRLLPLPGVEMAACRRSRHYEIVREGRTLFTNRQFLAARLWLEELFGKKPFPVADCSSPGCSGNAVYKTGMDEYIRSVKNFNKDGKE